MPLYFSVLDQLWFILVSFKYGRRCLRVSLSATFLLSEKKYTASSHHNKLSSFLSESLLRPSALFSNTFSANSWPRTISASCLCFSCSLFLPSGLAAHVLASGITGLVLNSRVVPPRSLQLLCWLNPIKGPETTHPARCCFLAAGRGEGRSAGWSVTRRKTHERGMMFFFAV